MNWDSGRSCRDTRKWDGSIAPGIGQRDLGEITRGLYGKFSSENGLDHGGCFDLLAER